jgi:hypothetical protein
MLITGNIFEGATDVQDETTKKVYLLCAHGTDLRFQYGKLQASNIFFLGGLVQNHLRTHVFFARQGQKII